MDMGFAIIGQLARHSRLFIRFLFIGPYVCSTLLSDPASRRRPCASLSLHLHQVVKRTFTFELSNMLGTLAVGTIITDRPPHRSRTCSFTHTLLPRLRDVETLPGMGSQNTSWGNPPVHQWGELLPSNLRAFASADQNAPPEPADATPE